MSKKIVGVGRLDEGIFYSRRELEKRNASNLVSRIIVFFKQLIEGDPYKNKLFKKAAAGTSTQDLRYNIGLPREE